MKTKFYLLISICALGIQLLQAQVPSTFYGLARRNDPDNEVFLATVDPFAGMVTNISPVSLSPYINLTGAALDPYSNLFHYSAADAFMSIDLTTGLLVDSATVVDPDGPSFFDNFRFNNSDSSLYGLTRVFYYDTITFEPVNELYLATIEPATGAVSRISTTSVGPGFALAGSAIDPYMMVFYYSTGTELVGLDMYTGEIYSTAPFVYPFDDVVMFDNFTYSCADTALYGLMRSNYFSMVYDSLFMDSVEVLDSTGIHLAKIDPSTGIITAISPYSIAMGGYSLNSGSTINPELMIYYYNNGYELVGVSMITGLIVSQEPLTFDNGQFFELMRIQSNCYGSFPMRLDPALANMDIQPELFLSMYPNPADNTLQVVLQEPAAIMEIYAADGAKILTENIQSGNNTINVASLAPGMYYVQCISDGRTATRQLVIY